MVRKSLWMAFHAISQTPLTTAWTLTWRNDTAGATIEHQDTPLACTRIYHEKGEQFSWDPEGAWCMDFWAEPTCATRIGYSCDGRVWEKAASRNLSAFDVYPMPEESRRVYGFLSTSSTTTPTPTPAATTLTVTHPATTGATQTAEAESHAGSSPPSSALSGGAIAGIVIGAVAGLALLAALCFFLGKRKPKHAQAAPEVPLSPAPPPAAGVGGGMSRTDTNRSYPSPYTLPTQPAAFPIEHKSPMSEVSATQSMYSAAPPYSPPAGVYHPPSAARVVELPGNYNQLSEMDGSSDLKRPVN